MKFKNYIETESGIKDTSTSPGTAGQVLSSTVTGTDWIDQGEIIAAAATLVTIQCKNRDVITLVKGTPVYQTGTVGATDIIEVAGGSALISDGAQPSIGLLQQDLDVNEIGYVVITGGLLNITTDPIDGLTPVTGQKVFVKSGGGLTLTKPTTELNTIQNMGLVGKVSVGNSGSITVSSIMRTNDVPNLPEGRIWIGDGNTIVSDTVYVDELNGRVGIGTILPGAELEVVGSGYFQNNLNIQSAISSAPVYGYPNVGAGQLIVGGVDDLGIFSPSVITLINQDTTINAGQDLGVLQFVGKDDTSSGYCSSQIIGTTFNASGSGDSGGGILRFLTNPGGTGAGNTEKMRILPSGNVGIGTTSPSSILHLEDSTPTLKILSNQFYNNSVIEMGNGAGPTTGLITCNNNPGLSALELKYDNGATGDARIRVGQRYLDFQIDGGTAMYINSSKNIGIGTTTPSQKLHVVGSGYFQNGSLYVGSTSNAMFNYISTFVITAGSGQTIALGGGPGNTNNNVLIGNGNLSVSGNVGIGITIPAQKLHVVGRVASTAGNGFQIINSYGSPLLSDYYGSFTTTASLYVGGPFSGQACYASAFNITSDYRLKENEAPLTEASSRIKKLKPIRFSYISSENIVDGFLAHEVAEVIPEAVTGEKDAVREDGSDELQGLDLSKIVPLLTAALQESITKIEQLEQRIQTLENK